MSSRRCRRHNGRRSTLLCSRVDAPIPPEPSCSERRSPPCFASWQRPPRSSLRSTTSSGSTRRLPPSRPSRSAAWVTRVPRRVVDPHEHDLDAPRVVAGRTVAAARARTTVGGSAPRIFTEQLGRSFPRPTWSDRRGVRRESLLRTRDRPPSGQRHRSVAPARSLRRARPRARSASARCRRRVKPRCFSSLPRPRPELRFVDPAALAAGEEAGLVAVASDGRITFSHPLYSSAVYSAAPTARRREAHRRLAELVHDPEERARHLALAAGPTRTLRQPSNGPLSMRAREALPTQLGTSASLHST